MPQEGSDAKGREERKPGNGRHETDPLTPENPPKSLFCCCCEDQLDTALWEQKNNPAPHQPRYILDEIAREEYREDTIKKLSEWKWTFDDFETFEHGDWARLGLDFKDEILLRSWWADVPKVTLEQISDFPPSVKRNVLTYVWSIPMVLPALAIGLLSDIDQDNPPSTGDLELQLVRVTIPGFALIWFIFFLSIRLRGVMGQDIVEERSPGTNLAESMSDVLTSTGVISALFLTIIIAMMQAEAPIPNEEGRLICQYYQLFCLAGLMVCTLGLLMSSALFSYMAPLDERASWIYVKQFMDYCGEPYVQIIFTMNMFANAIACWIFGRYGKGLGFVCVLTMYLITQRYLLAQAYLSLWSNPLIDTGVRNINTAGRYGKGQWANYFKKMPAQDKLDEKPSG